MKRQNNRDFRSQALKDESRRNGLAGMLLRSYRLLDGRERRKAFVLLAGIFANSFVDILGLLMVVPVIGLTVNPSAIQSNEYLHQAFLLSGIATEENFLIALAVLMVGAFLFKALFGLAVTYYQTRFSLTIAHRLSGLMFRYHFTQSLEKMRSTKSGSVLREIGGWPTILGKTVMTGLLSVLNEATVVLFIGIGLALYDPIVFAGVSLILGLGTTIIRKATKARLIRYSDIRRELEPETSSILANAINGFLEIITFRAVDIVRKTYLKKTQRIFRVNMNLAVLTQFPAKLFEVLAVTGVSVAIIISLLVRPGEDFFATLTLMALSAYRVMPAVARMNGKILSIRANSFILDTMEKGVEFVRTEEQRTKTTPKVPGESSPLTIDVRELTLGYRSLDSPVLERLNTHFASGEITGVVGPSGSGKSTLISALLALHRPESGKITASWSDGSTIDINQHIEQKDWILLTGYLSQNPFLFSGTVRENLTLGVPKMGINEARVAELIDKMDMASCLGPLALDFELQEGGANLSGGQQQRLALIRAMQVDRPILILDEATSALDVPMRDVVFGLLRERARTGTMVILVTHDPELAQQCDHVVRLELVGPDAP